MLDFLPNLLLSVVYVLFLPIPWANMLEFPCRKCYRFGCFMFIWGFYMLVWLGLEANYLFLADVFEITAGAARARWRYDGSEAVVFSLSPPLWFWCWEVAFLVGSCCLSWIWNILSVNLDFYCGTKLDLFFYLPSSYTRFNSNVEWSLFGLVCRF